MLVDLYFFKTEFNFVIFLFYQSFDIFVFFTQYLYFLNGCYSRLICMFVKQVKVLTRKIPVNSKLLTKTLFCLSLQQWCRMVL